MRLEPSDVDPMLFLVTAAVPAEVLATNDDRGSGDYDSELRSFVSASSSSSAVGRRERVAR